MSPNSVDVAVIGAAGNTGAPLVRALVRRGARVRAIVHRPTQSIRVADAHEVNAVEIDDAKSLTSALEGAAVVHFIPPVYNPAEERYGSLVLTAAIDAGVKRATYHSVLHPATPGMPHHMRKSRVELLFRESPLKWTIFQPAMYVQTPLFFFDRAAREIRPGFSVTKPFAPVDVEDVADATAVALTEDGHDSATYELAGSEQIDFNGIAAILSFVLGYKVLARSVDPDALVLVSSSAVA